MKLNVKSAVIIIIHVKNDCLKLTEGQTVTLEQGIINLSLVFRNEFVF